jgi:hypothetical protein
MSDLHLHVKTDYFEAIKRGEKTEEYRLWNLYWIRRMFHYVDLPEPALPCEMVVFDSVIIYNAYKPATPENVLRFPWRGWTMETITHPHFGPNPVKVFAIKLEKEAILPPIDKEKACSFQELEAIHNLEKALDEYSRIKAQSFMP